MVCAAGADEESEMMRPETRFWSWNFLAAEQGQQAPQAQEGKQAERTSSHQRFGHTSAPKAWDKEIEAPPEPSFWIFA